MKCTYTRAILPAYVSKDVAPTKKKPFSTILAYPFVHTIDLLLTSDVFESLKDELLEGQGVFAYQRVHMKLSELLEGEFFNEYMKIGNVLMLSEGRAGVDNCYSVKDGILMLELDRASYERCGLVGKALQGPGQKHNNSRFAIEINLRLPSMLHGRKGFERVVWAFKNVLNQSVTWLFLDLKTPNDNSGPIRQFAPLSRKVKPEVLKINNAKTPFPPTTEEHMHGEIVSENEEFGPSDELFEWVSLAMLNSPRIHANDTIDSFLSRYAIPERTAISEGNQATGHIAEIVRIRWRAFIDVKQLASLWLRISVAASTSWVAMGVSCYRAGRYMILQNGGRTVHEWKLSH